MSKIDASLLFLSRDEAILPVLVYFEAYQAIPSLVLKFFACLGLELEVC
jgi:hypothetical protein